MSTPTTVKSEYLAHLIERFGYMLDVEAICEILEVSRPTVDKMIENGELPAAKIGNRARIATSDFVIWWDARVLERHKELVKGAVSLEKPYK